MEVQAQYTGTAVMASGDGSDWGSSSGSENQGSRARQGSSVRARSWTDFYGKAMETEPRARATDLAMEARTVWWQRRAQAAKARQLCTAGLGGARHWLVQAVAPAVQSCGKGDSGKDWGG